MKKKLNWREIRASSWASVVEDCYPYMMLIFAGLVESMQGCDGEVARSPRDVVYVRCSPRSRASKVDVPGLEGC